MYVCMYELIYYISHHTIAVLEMTVYVTSLFFYFTAPCSNWF